MTTKPEVVAWLHEMRQDSDVITDKVRYVWGTPRGSMGAYSIPLIRLTDHESARAADKARIAELEEALGYYARGDHLILADHSAWDTCSGEPLNWLHDEAGTASVEDGSVANAALSQQAEPAVEQLPYWEPCNPGCDPEFNGKRSRHCAELCHGARYALSQQGKEGES